MSAGDGALQVAPDLARLLGELDALARFSDDPPPAVTRVALTPTERAACAFVAELCREAGLSVRMDPLGNLFARWEGADPHLPPVATGSHIDALPHGGRFDGTVGVLGALEALRALRRAGFVPRRSLELIVFLGEEPTRFGVGCLGSRALCGALSPAELRGLHDAEGRDLEEVRAAAGLGGRLEDVALRPGAYAAFVELHIEQGPLLERQGVPIGVVTAIAAPAALEIVLEGEGGHAGTVLMRERRDALVAGAEVALAVEAAALGTGHPDTVATTGIFRVFPGAINSIPSRVVLGVDLRDTDGARRDGALQSILRAVEEVAARRGVTARWRVLHADPPAACAPEVVEAAERAAAALGLPAVRMVSRAYHDALFMARIAPAGMIFIPCRGGISHRPDEDVAPEWLLMGVQVLAGTLQRLAGTA